jgi:hypothetical protein
MSRHSIRRRKLKCAKIRGGILRTSCAKAQPTHADGPNQFCPLVSPSEKYAFRKTYGLPPRTSRSSPAQPPGGKAHRVFAPSWFILALDSRLLSLDRPNNLSPSAKLVPFREIRMYWLETCPLPRNTRAKGTSSRGARRFHSPAPSPQSPAPHTSIVPQPQVVYDVGFPQDPIGRAVAGRSCGDAPPTPGAVGSSGSSACPNNPLPLFHG